MGSSARPGARWPGSCSGCWLVVRKAWARAECGCYWDFPGGQGLGGGLSVGSGEPPPCRTLSHQDVVRRPRPHGCPAVGLTPGLPPPPGGLRPQCSVCEVGLPSHLIRPPTVPEPGPCVAAPGGVPRAGARLLPPAPPAAGSSGPVPSGFPSAGPGWGPAGGPARLWPSPHSCHTQSPALPTPARRHGTHRGAVGGGQREAGGSPAPASSGGPGRAGPGVRSPGPSSAGRWARRK